MNSSVYEIDKVFLYYSSVYEIMKIPWERNIFMPTRRKKIFY